MLTNTNRDFPVGGAYGVAPKAPGAKQGTPGVQTIIDNGQELRVRFGKARTRRLLGWWFAGLFVALVMAACIWWRRLT